MNTGASEREKAALAEGLGRLLADSYLLFIKTHAFHWNVRGPAFYSLHLMFEEQYNELFKAVDEIAERIRALGLLAPGSYRSWSDLSSIEESDEDLKARQMIKELLSGQETVAQTARKLLNRAQKAGDEATAELLTARIRQHEKTAWMLSSLLED